MTSLHNTIRKGALRDFYLSRFDELFEHSSIRKKILQHGAILGKNYKTKDERNLFRKILGAYVEEAELTLSLLKK